MPQVDVRMKDVMKRIKAISERLKREYGAQRVILFGSYARGEATEDSDVDILVIAPTTERFFERMATVLAVVRDLYNGLALSPIVLSPKEVAKRLEIGDPFVQEILDEGMEL
ncbi:MAG TPA: nucleotidyltransferase domain-containing protein [Candidatus Brocadiia bacterium]|nr:nucleotidyltransferase domain-containing protein [Candidatus Brocadiales bacterium]